MQSIKRRLIFRGRRTFSALAEFEEAAVLVAKEKRGLLKNPGLALPGSRERARIRDYAKERFGSVGYAPWLEFYTIFRGRFHEGWVPANFFRLVAMPKLNGAHYHIGSSRSLMTRLVSTPMLPDLAHFVSGEWREPSGARIERDKLLSLIFAVGPEVCVKIENSSRGRGITFAHREQTDLAALERHGDLVVQSLIRQHPLFDDLSPNAVATLRVMTGKLPSRAPIFVGSYLRCGLGQRRALRVGSTLRVGISHEDGTLAAFASDMTWRRHPAHPETGAAFEGWRIPSYHEMVASCLDLHDRLPQLGMIGWDVILDASGTVRLMEVNTGEPGIKFIEMSQGPTLRAFELERYAPGRR
jgi:hypothetical protein